MDIFGLGNYVMHDQDDVVPKLVKDQEQHPTTLEYFYLVLIKD